MPTWDQKLRGKNKARVTAPQYHNFSISVNPARFEKMRKLMDTALFRYMGESCTDPKDATRGNLLEHLLTEYVNRP